MTEYNMTTEERNIVNNIRDTLNCVVSLMQELYRVSGAMVQFNIDGPPGAPRLERLVLLHTIETDVTLNHGVSPGRLDA